MILLGGGYAARCEGLLDIRRIAILLLVGVGDISAITQALKWTGVWVASSEGMYCANAFRTGRRNSSFATKCLRVRICRLPIWDNLLVCGLYGLYQAGHSTGIRTICNECFTILSIIRIDYCSGEQNYLYKTSARFCHYYKLRHFEFIMTHVGCVLWILCS